MKKKESVMQWGRITSLALSVILCVLTITVRASTPQIKKEHPKIVNIINFVRFCEPRDAEITEDVLFQTTVRQVEMMKKYHLRGTFLLQYDALKDSRYQRLFKSLPSGMVEIGGWWEIPQPLVEDAGMKWRGRYPWDWHANVGFATGYSPVEREKLIDTYMKTFKGVFGHYPKSVGSWFIDERSLDYMVRKYGIESSCNCRDQIGTDGYTLWGGYWNQGYYPSRKNAYMPAQSQKEQIFVPIFRMLGSDPIRQYDDGIGQEMQGVATLEPSFSTGGADTTMVNWYFKQFIEGPCMQYGYVQVGQENSFTWETMKKGFEIQLPLVAKLRDEGKVDVRTLEETGRWFKKNFKTTPATSVSILQDMRGGEKKTVWFNSRYYRINLLWDKGSMRFRDIHLFDENLPSDYLNTAGTSTSCNFYTLPLVDGNQWSSEKKMAGLRLIAKIDDKEVEIEGGIPQIDDTKDGELHVSWPLTSVQGKFIVVLNEKRAVMRLESALPIEWALNLTTAEGAKLPFQDIEGKKICCSYKNFKYFVSAEKGYFKGPDSINALRINPENNTIVLNFAERINAKGK